MFEAQLQISTDTGGTLSSRRARAAQRNPIVVNKTNKKITPKQLEMVSG